MKNQLILIVVAILFISINLNAQIININNTTDPESVYGTQQLVEDVLISSPCAQVDSFSEQVFGTPVDTANKSYGFFKKPAGSSFPFDKGIILTSGSANPAGNIVNPGIISEENNLSKDPDLELALGLNGTENATFIKFNFVAVSSTISFRYLMASEEYNKRDECTFSDAFAFLLRPVGTTTYTNLAIIPGTTTPVSTTNVHPNVPSNLGVTGCAAINEAFFEGYDLGDTNYGGRTKVLIASATVVPNQTYEIKLVIADQGDQAFDSAVFLEAGSFSLDADLGSPKLIASNNAACGGSVLLDATIVANSYKWFKDNVEIPGAIGQTYNANLGDGFYKVEATLAVGCIADDEIEVQFTSQPSATKPINIVQCDTDDDGLMFFDFTLKNSEIENGQTNITTTYYSSQADADSRTNELPNPYQTGNATIYARVENNASTNCYATTSFNVEVLKEPSPLDAANISPLELCDNPSSGTDTDGYASFNLSSKNTEILNGQTLANFSIDYYTDSSYNAIYLIPNPATFINTIVNGQTIYVRVSNKLNSNCFKNTSFTISVLKLPTVNSIVQLTQCDDNTDSISLFNLTEGNTLISSGSSEIFTYYLTQAEAETGLVADQITNFTSYPNPTPINSFVYARIENTNGCYRTARINLIVGASQIPSTFNTLEYYMCDDALVDGDKRNGIASFDFSNAESSIDALFPTKNVTVTFYNNEADALAELNVISDLGNHRNEGYPNTQNIYVRVDSDVTNDCVGLGHYVTLYVEELPIENPVTIARQCDDNPFDTEVATTFNTSNLENDILLGQSNVNVTYFDSAGNPLVDINGNFITSPFPNSFRTLSQIITARVTNNSTNTPSGNACFEEITIEFIVDIAPIANTIAIAPVCDDGISDVDGFHEFDTSNIESAILGTQTGMIVSYTDGIGTTLPSPLPNPFNSNTQTILVSVENPINNACVATTTIDFIVNPLPDFNITTPQIVCLNNPTTVLTIDWEFDNYTYDWKDELGNVLVTNSTSLPVTIGGVYEVTAANSLGCKRSKTIQVNESIIATITDEDITVIDDAENNSIAITTTNLGIGDYEFAIKKTDDFISDFQDEPYFENLTPGFYTLFIQDKNNCGIAQIEFSVIGFPKFFTPNNDGENDTWKVLGINENFYATSAVYIFDRFGKLITQIDPTGEGWDGNFNGKLLTSTDYWFSIELIDSNGNSRIRKGHFSLIRR
tara:strand:+ start:82581 stop:86207 length:3627 start_codon:yes stop_codon:yes gene_type:complete